MKFQVFNYAYVAFPEVGNQVMVSFEHNHPDRPFVMGGMFHGKVGLGGGASNRLKSIQYAVPQKPYNFLG